VVLYLHNLVFVEQGFKKIKSCDMVPVGMGEENMAGMDLIKGCSKVADPGSSINDDGFSAFCNNLDTGGISSIFQEISARYGNRPP